MPGGYISLHKSGATALTPQLVAMPIVVGVLVMLAPPAALLAGYIFRCGGGLTDSSYSSSSGGDRGVAPAFAGGDRGRERRGLRRRRHGVRDLPGPVAGEQLEGAATASPAAASPCGCACAAPAPFAAGARLDQEDGHASTVSSTPATITSVQLVSLYT
ncbi:hypothetical protein E2562_012317 [Oryza meyeriana var. granulata]|uniref:Uncharacterized protein n=1 Tax=Oryza meyeriana var. granulata TaxID=110450 RepID=A0A6G1DHB9_9ORYZ|nr:hypothetical protein E2562_012317 [Oryza meyeriana var. granulata]